MTDLLTAGGIRNVTVVEAAAGGKLRKHQTMLTKPIRLLGLPPWKYAKFGGSMVVHTHSDGSALMTFCVGFVGSGSWAGGERASLLSAVSTDGGFDFHYTAVIANATWFPGKDGDNSDLNGTLTGATEHDVVGACSMFGH